jgi:hypothetical protein
LFNKVAYEREKQIVQEETGDDDEGPSLEELMSQMKKI